MKTDKPYTRFISYLEWILIIMLIAVIISVWKYEELSTLNIKATSISPQHTELRKPQNMKLEKALMKPSQDVVYNLKDLPHHRNYETAPLPSKAAKNIFFLKIHKTGSTTIYNMMCRFAWKYNLRATTYAKRPFTIKQNETLMTFLVPLFMEGESEKYNIAFEHSRYEPNAIKKILYEPTTHVTMIRHPFTWLDSFLHYEKLIVRLQLDENNAAGSFINKLKDPIWLQDHRRRLYGIQHWNNEMVFNINPDDRGTEKAFRELGKVFLVGIHEHYEETVILMKRRFNWSFKDVLYAPLRSQTYKHSTPNKTLYDKLCAWMPHECKLYEYFKRIHVENVKNEGHEMAEEVEYFKMALRKISQFCYPFFNKVSKNENFDSLTGVQFPGNNFHDSFTYTYMDCALSRFDEYIYRPLFFYRQNPDFGYLEKCPVMRDHHHMCPEVGKLFFNSSNVIEDLMRNPYSYLWQ